ncbi:MAG: tail fiber domain-containing protein, partial [Bacillota bacterium]|nr:tail fiber domain-containing protein [Bacillota bacterium]
LISNSFVDNLHKHSQLSYSKGIALSVDDSGNLSANGNLSLSDRTLYLRDKNNGDNGIRWCGNGNPFAGLNTDGPVIFGSYGGILGAKVSGNEKAVLSWNGSGNVGIGSVDPKDDKLDVEGSMRILSKTNPVRFTSVWTGFPDATINQSEICNDTTYHKALMIVGNQSAGQGRKVAVWDRLDVNGFLQVYGSMKVSQSITPSAGNGNNGIIFPSDPGGGLSDAAWIQYYPKVGESCTLEIGVSNDGDDNISLMASGKVGIGTRNPLDKLDVYGSGRILSDSNPIRFTSSWSGFPDNVTNQAEICNDTSTYKALMIVGNRSSGQGRKVAIWDRLDVNGYLQVNGGMNITGNLNIGGSFNCGQLSSLDVGTSFSASVRCADFLIGYPGRRGSPGRALVDNGNCLVVNYGPDWPYTMINSGLIVNGAITPSAGNSENRGIMFPKDPGGGGGDAAWIRYYSDGSRGGGENMTLEIGVSNDYFGWGGWDGGDRIYMHASGGVFIGGYWYYWSSRDYKEDITDLNTKTAKQLLDGLNPVTFRFKGEETKTTMGFIAEDVPQELSASDQRAISPMEIVTVLTSVVKEQQKSIQKLQKQVASIQGAGK